jgi:threonine/homoserine/homoserine lactone efflux protein
MDLLPRLGVSLAVFLVGVALIVWSTRIMAFPGSILGLIEDLLPEGWRSNLRRVVNSFFGLLFILFALLIFFLARK